MKKMTCARCGRKEYPTPAFDYYVTPFWKGEGRVCENCFDELVMTNLPNTKGFVRVDDKGKIEK